jgi:hypothetical protein
VEGEVLGLPKECDRLAPERAPSPPAHQHRRMTRIIVGNIVGVFAHHRRPIPATSSAFCRVIVGIIRAARALTWGIDLGPCA